MLPALTLREEPSAPQLHYRCPWCDRRLEKDSGRGSRILSRRYPRRGYGYHAYSVTPGKTIEFEEKAYAYTEVPEDLKSLAKQRYRWVYGTLQCLWKHRGALFNKKHNSLGFVALPNMWLFQYIYQTISPIADLLFIIALLTRILKKRRLDLSYFTCWISVLLSMRFDWKKKVQSRSVHCSYNESCTNS